MNVQAAIRRAEPIKLTVDAFLLLKEAGAFADFAKCELIDGELIGVAAGRDEEAQSDRPVPIKLRIGDYLRLDSAGAFQGYEKTELIDGLVYAVSPQYRAHMVVASEFAYSLRRALEESGSGLYVGIEGSVALSDTDLPQPDILVTDEPRGAGPVPSSSALLLVEVADTSIDLDLTRKARLYASHDIPEYWVADVNARLIHQMWAPLGEAYQQRREIAFGVTLEAVTIAGLSVSTDRL